MTRRWLISGVCVPCFLHWHTRCVARATRPPYCSCSHDNREDGHCA